MSFQLVIILKPLRWMKYSKTMGQQCHGIICNRTRNQHVNVLAACHLAKTRVTIVCERKWMGEWDKIVKPFSALIAYCKQESWLSRTRRERPWPLQLRENNNTERKRHMGIMENNMGDTASFALSYSVSSLMFLKHSLSSIKKPRYL